MASLSLQPLPSPPTAATATTPTTSTTNPTNQLETFDPSLSFLNNFPANQIDDLENVLLPHLHSNNEDDQQQQQQRRSKSPAVINTDNSKSGNGSGIRAANEDEVKSLREREKSDAKSNSTSKKVFRQIRPQDDLNKEKKVASEPVILQPDQSEDEEDHDQGQGQHHSSDNEEDPIEERENVATNNKKQVIY